MNKRSIGLLALVFVLGNVFPVVAQAGNAGIVFVNDTGADITEMVISPSVTRFPDNRNVLAVQDIQQEDGAVFAIDLPVEMDMVDCFVIEIVSGGKHFITPNEIKIDLQNGKTTTIHLSTTEKKKIGDVVEAGGKAVLASTILATTKKMAPKVAATAVKKVAPKVAVAAATKAVPAVVGTITAKLGSLAIPTIGPIVFAGILVAEGVYTLVKVMRTPGDLYTQVYYE